MYARCGHDERINSNGVQNDFRQADEIVIVVLSYRFSRTLDGFTRYNVVAIACVLVVAQTT